MNNRYIILRLSINPYFLVKLVWHKLHSAYFISDLYIWFRFHFIKLFESESLQKHNNWKLVYHYYYFNIMLKLLFPWDYFFFSRSQRLLSVAYNLKHGDSPLAVGCLFGFFEQKLKHPLEDSFLLLFTESYKSFIVCLFFIIFLFTKPHFNFRYILKVFLFI